MGLAEHASLVCHDSARSQPDLTGLANRSGLFAAGEIRMSAARQPQCAALGRTGEEGAWFALVDVFAASHRHAIDCPWLNGMLATPFPRSVIAVSRALFQVPIRQLWCPAI